jgi:hypothetical protein
VPRQPYSQEPNETQPSAAPHTGTKPHNATELTCENRQMLKPTIPVRPFPASRDLNNRLDRFSELLCGAS